MVCSIVSPNTPTAELKRILLNCNVSSEGLKHIISNCNVSLMI